MLIAFQSFIQEKKLIPDRARTLVAVSAGVDSTVLCHLFHRAGFPFGMAHCNFQLRRAASDGDEFFCEKLAGQLGVPFFSTRFDTRAFAEKNKMGTQEAARHLRYEWLTNTTQTAEFQFIATAHHNGDNIETVLFNFAKGTGIRGMRGILPKRDNIIRPLLFATKTELLKFAEQEKIEYREDSSNLTHKYTRNRMRHQVVPELEKMAPGFQQNARGTIERLAEAEALLGFAIQQIRKKVVQESDGELCIDLPKLRSYPAPSTVLYELLRPLGFTASQVEDVLQMTENQTGSGFQSASHRLLFDRFLLKIKKQEKAEGVTFHIGNDMESLAIPTGHLHFHRLDKVPVIFPESANRVWLDFDRLHWPLTLRQWQAGDVFQPLGMGGQHKKLQDFFTDRKLSRFDKENVWILESQGEICWVVGMRTDERFKVRDSTKTILEVAYMPSRR